MDESMNSVHSISAMDISPATSPKTALNPIPSNQLLLNAFQQQQQSLTNISFSAPNINAYTSMNKNLNSDEYDNNSNSLCLYSTVLTENTDEIKAESMPVETNQLRQRITSEPLSPIVEPISAMKESQTNTSGKSFSKLLFLLIPVLLLTSYLITQYPRTSIHLPRPTTWQNASEYLTAKLIGQDQGLREFKDVMDKHKNFSVVLIEGGIGTGKSYLASSLEKFLPTTLISTNTLLGLSPGHWIESDRLSFYLSSHLSPSAFQFLILDDLDLLSNNEQYCRTLTTVLYSMNKNKNMFILLLHTGAIPNFCQVNLSHIITKSIKFNRLQRPDIHTCIKNEAYTQNVQPSFTNEQIEKISNLVEYMNEEGVLYSTTGCKQIPSLVMLASKGRLNDN